MSISTLWRAAQGRRVCGVKQETGPTGIPDFERLGLKSADSTPVFAEPDLSIHLPDWMPLNQSSTASCVAHAWCEAEVITMKARHNRTVPMPSRRAAYYWARERAGDENVDDGCQPSNMLKAVAYRGLPPETRFPWSVARINQRPGIAARWDSRDHVGQRDSYQIFYSRFQGRIDAVRAAIESGRAVMMSIPVMPQFEACSDASVIPYGRVPISGYHMVLVLGCSTDGVIHGLNSWGPKWGASGQFWLAPEYLKNTSSLIVVDPQEATR